MKNFVKPGEVQTFTASGAVVSGQPIMQGHGFGIATGAVANGVESEMLVRGVVSVTKPGSQAWTRFAAIYYDVGGAFFTTAASDNRLVGWATKAVGAGATETTGEVYLDGVARPADTT